MFFVSGLPEIPKNKTDARIVIAAEKRNGRNDSL
jgi:hypothetical protein